MRSVAVLGGRGAQSRRQDAPDFNPSDFWKAFLGRSCAHKAHLGTGGSRKRHQKSSFGVYIGARGAKNASQKGVRKKHENCMNKKLEDGRLWETKNLSKCVTVGDFIVEKTRKSMPKWFPKCLKIHATIRPGPQAPEACWGFVGLLSISSAPFLQHCT